MKFQDAEKVSPEHRNKIVVTTVFALKPETTNKYDRSAHIPLKTFSSGVWSEERASYLNDEVKRIYHHMPLKYYDTRKTDYVCVSEFQNHEDKDEKNWLNLPLDQQVY